MLKNTRGTTPVFAAEAPILSLFKSLATCLIMSLFERERGKNSPNVYFAYFSQKGTSILLKSKSILDKEKPSVLQITCPREMQTFKKEPDWEADARNKRQTETYLYAKEKQIYVVISAKNMCKHEEMQPVYWRNVEWKPWRTKTGLILSSSVNGDNEDRFYTSAV